MKSYYYFRLPEKLRFTYNEIEEDMIFSGYDLNYFYSKYREVIGNDQCKRVIASLAGDVPFILLDKGKVQAVKELLYVDCVSNLKEGLSKELDYFTFSIDCLLNKAGIMEHDELIIASCLCSFLQLRDIKCSLSLNMSDHTICNVIDSDNHVRKIQIKNQMVNELADSDSSYIRALNWLFERAVSEKECEE